MVKKILCIDGGGIRGVGAAYLLTKLDERLAAEKKAAVTECFDLYVGTSTGCILAAGLAASGLPGCSLTTKDLMNLYFERGADMFVPTPASMPTFDLLDAKYRTSSKNAVLQHVLGPVTLGQLQRNFLGTFYSLRPNPGPVFAQGGPQYRKIDKDHYKDLLLSEIVNASSNAPIYFDPSSVGNSSFFGVDGGVFANNPAVSSFVESRKIFPGEDSVLVVSIGCGRKPAVYPSWNQWGLLHWAAPSSGVPIIEVLMGAQADVVEHQMLSLLDLGKSYFRLQFDLSAAGSAKIDDVTRSNLDLIVGAAEDFLMTGGGNDMLEAIVDLL